MEHHKISKQLNVSTVSCDKKWIEINYLLRGQYKRTLVMYVLLSKGQYKEMMMMMMMMMMIKNELKT